MGVIHNSYPKKVKHCTSQLLGEQEKLPEKWNSRAVKVKNSLQKIVDKMTSCLDSKEILRGYFA